MAVNITLQSAISLAEEIVASKPEDFVYVNNQGQRAEASIYGEPRYGCDYFTPEGEGSCIVGKVVLAAGVSGWAADFNTSAFATTYLENLRERGIIEIDNRAIGFLHEIQHHQDRGVTWAESLERAKKFVANHL